METQIQNSHQVAWSLRELFAQAGITPIDPRAIPERIVSSLTDDSRKVTPGALFVAVRGAGADGHRFIKNAIQSGAAAIVAEDPVAPQDSVASIRVSDSRDAIAKLAASFYGLRGSKGSATPRLIGVTGTNGKTTVTWLLRSIFQAAGERTALIGTVEYDLAGERRSAPLTTPGPLALCEMLAESRDRGATFAVMEVSSHALDQRRCDGLTFDAAVFTNLTGDHLDYHGTMEDYARAKSRLFAGLSHTAKAIVNRDDPMGELFAGSSNALVISYGAESPGLDVSAHVTTMDRFGTRFVLRTPTFQAPIRLPLIGKHNVMNALAAAATATAIGISEDAICAGLEVLRGVPGRLQRVESDGWPFSVIVDYAHTDDALRNVLTALRPLTRGRLICVFGCGGDRDRSKRPRMARAVGELADIAWVTSDNPRSEAPAAIIDEILPGFGTEIRQRRMTRCRVETNVDRRGAIHAAIEDARPGDTVLIAGKGHENYQLIGGRVLAFDDLEVARECLSERMGERIREVVT
ncbi:MAG: UDP-N-acetylmuramoyl-L-alanyl-D-glutamate--2,6-diaminopimelate ligase [Planctomycetes bacterium]|nr:UDP-N-acetylmuramoyl-L-alanyl-D-glutamate--2,6-diaminopimelate ligase [Planctomycetota bacterium]